MPGTEDLQEYIEERLLDLDPDVDLSAGSPAQTEVIDPIVRRFAPDPFEMDVSTFIKTRLEQEYPGLNKEDGEALADLLIKPIEALIDPLVREVEFLRKNKSLAYPELLAPEEADSLMGNFFVSRTRGTRSVGQVRLWFNAPTAISIGVGNEAGTVDGLKYIPRTPQEVSAEQMLFNQDGSLFYADFGYEAETEGSEYNVDKNTITSIAGISTAVKVRNLERFRDGVPEETTISFIDRGESSLNERSLVVPRGAIARLFDEFGDLQHLQVVGFKDEEMDRDVIKGGGLGPIVVYGSDGQTSDDGDGDGFTDIFESPAGGFILTIGSIGEVSNFNLTVGDKDFPVVEVLADNQIRVTSPITLLQAGQTPEPEPEKPELASFLLNEPFYIRENILTLSDIPGGIINPIGPNGKVIVRGDEIHIGGCADFYARGVELEEEEIVIEAITDEDPLLEGSDMETNITGLPSDIVRVDALTDLTDSSDNKRVKIRHSLVIETGGDAGTYQILKVNPRGTAKNELQVYPVPGNVATGLRYRVVDEIDIDLSEPKNPRGNGADLKTVLGSTQVSTVSAVDFDAIGGEVDDVLRVLGNSPNAGDHNVNQIMGTGNALLVLAAEMRRTSSSEPWELFKLQNALDPPIVRLTTVDLLDSSKQDTGGIIPYAQPVDIQSYAFHNIGKGEKVVVTDAIVGIIGSVDLQTSPAGVNGKTLRISVNRGATTTVTFSGVTTPQEIVDQINTGVANYNLAALYVIEGELRLSIRSRNNWVVVSSTGGANSDLGLSTTYDEDNRQIYSPDLVSWLTYSLEAEKDSVYIQTGPNVEYWHLQLVTKDRLYVARVDDLKRAVFPLSDHNAMVKVGSRSFGKVRCYFLEPTSFEVKGDYRKALSRVSSVPIAGEHAPNVVFSAIQEDEEPRTEFSLDVYGDSLSFKRFFPDPELEHTLIPATDESVPDNLEITATNDWAESEDSPSSGPGEFSRGSEIDMLLREVLQGDVLEITYQPIQGSQDITATTGIAYSDVQGKTLVFSLENGPNKTVTFTVDATGPSRLVGEINQQLGETVAYVEEDSLGSKKYLRLEANINFILRSTGTAMTKLGLTAGNNDANAKGKYEIGATGYISGATSNHMRLTLSSKIGEGSWTQFTAGQAGPSQHFKIHRPGTQRVSSTDMEQNVEGNLYYADIELVSYGADDEFNIEPDRQLEVEHYVSDGYWLYNEDNSLTFSREEVLKMRISRRILAPGPTDSPENMTQISQQNIQVNYERSSLVDQIQSFAGADLDRVLNASILVRHLQPHFISFAMMYQEGSKASIVEEDAEDYINGLLPDEVLESSALTDLPRRRGAGRVEAPVELIAVVHNVDRTIRVDRSKDSVSRGRLATFIPDVLTIEREQQS